MEHSFVWHYPTISLSNPNLFYTMKGAELKYDNSMVKGTARFSLNYIEVPILGVLNFTQHINIHGGIYFASLNNVRIKNIGNSEDFNFEKELSDSNFETLDYGLVIGLGGDFDKTSFGIRYDYGIRGIAQKKSPYR